jgi:hypothetical protein
MLKMGGEQMRTLGGTITAIAIGSLMAATPSDAANKHYPPAHAYDGLWSVLIRTQFGPCDPSYRYPARIVGGQVVQADNDFSYQISGVVVGSGAIAVTVSKGLGSATGYGRLRGGSGGGRWSAGNNQCYGTWSAIRRASN